MFIPWTIFIVLYKKLGDIYQGDKMITGEEDHWF